MAVSRLVVLNAVSAADNGAAILLHSKFIAAKHHSGHWQIELEHTDGSHSQHRAKVLINAAGPWVDRVLDQCHITVEKKVRLVKGSHIVVSKLYQGDHAYLLQHTDKRIIFVLPYESNYTLIGTTDIPFDGEPNQVVTSAEEETYLCDCVNKYFKQQISPAHIVWRYSGVRPLQQDEAEHPEKVTRDYHLALNARDEHPPILSVFGGKLTTYRKLAEHALTLLKPYFPTMGPAWTAKLPLPGGDMQPATPNEFAAKLQKSYTWLDHNVLLRLVHQYGSRVHLILQQAQSADDLGMHFGHGLYQAEVDYLIQHELAAIRAVVTETQARVEKIGTKQEALALAVNDLTVSVDTLKRGVAEMNSPAPQQNSDEAEALKQMLTDTCEQLGGSVVNMHRDFAVLVQHLGPAFAQVDRTVTPFAAAIAGFTATETEQASDRSASV